MRRTLFAVAAWIAVLAVAGLAAPPPEAEVQGFYEGAWKGGAGEGGKLEARVVAQGKNVYKIHIDQQAAGGKVTKAVLDGKPAGDKLVFGGKARGVEWEGVYANGEIRGRAGQGGEFELARVIKKSPTLGKKPPEGAVVLLDGKDFSQLARRGGAQWFLGDMTRNGWTVWEVPLRIIAGREPAQWPSKDTVLPEGWELGKERRRADTVIGIGDDGSIQIPRGGMNSKQRFEGSFDNVVGLPTDLVERLLTDLARCDPTPDPDAEDA